MDWTYDFLIQLGVDVLHEERPPLDQVFAFVDTGRTNHCLILRIECVIPWLLCTNKMHDLDRILESRLRIEESQEFKLKVSRIINNRVDWVLTV